MERKRGILERGDSTHRATVIKNSVQEVIQGGEYGA